MQVMHVPKLGVKYWAALCLASVFGANTGDFFANVLRLGHVSGLPLLAVLLAVVLLAERFDSVKQTAYFWFAIIIIRTSATNLGDVSHDLKLKPVWVILALAILLVLVNAVFGRRGLAAREDGTASENGPLPTNWVYWLSMLIAGTLGTVVGDYFSYRLRLGNLGATLVLGAVLACVFFFFRKGLAARQTRVAPYWLAVVLIRSAGTAAGDLIAHGRLGLALSTLVTGVAFVGALVLFRERRELDASAAPT